MDESIDIKIDTKRIEKYFEEPLFTVSIITFLIVIIRPFFDITLLQNVSLLNTLTLSVVFMSLACIACIYFVYIYFKNNIKNYYFIGIPGLVFIVTLFSWYADKYTDTIARDYTALSIVFALFLLFYSLALHRILKPQTSAILAIFLSGLLIHLIPAASGYLSAFDPHWYYKWSDQIVNPGQWQNQIVNPGLIPEHGYLTYPAMEGIDLSNRPFLVSILMASLATTLKPLGITLHNVATLYPGIFSAFIVLVLYCLVRDLFSGMKPYNYIAAILAVFMLILSPGFASKAIANNCEDDVLGMFLLVTSFLLFTISFKRKSLKYAFLCGFSFLLLRMAWGGYSYAVVVLGTFSAFYAVMNFIHKKNCVEHMPYFILPIGISFLYPLILHARGEMPSFILPPYIVLMPFGGAILLAFLLEMIRTYRYGKIEAESRIEDIIQRYIFSIGGLIMVLGIISIVFIGPLNIFNYLYSQIAGVKVEGVVGVTIAEQNPLASTFLGFLDAGYYRFGIALLIGVGMIPILLYLALVKRSMGSAFILAWSLPMLWGVVHKTAFIFTSSVPITVLGATIGLLSATNKKEFKGSRITPTLIIFCIPLLFLPFFGTNNYWVFRGTTPMHMGEYWQDSTTGEYYVGSGVDRFYWDTALQWLKTETEYNDAVLTWWDYGHWIGPISHRPVIIDNLQQDHYEIQDVARFFVNKTTEEDAFEIVEKYRDLYGADVYKEVYKNEDGVNLKWVVIDWTMIGKGGALHTIATGDIDKGIPGSGRNYGQCVFRQDLSILQPQYVVDEHGTTSYVKKIVFGYSSEAACGLSQGAALIIFYIKNDREISEITVMDRYGSEIPWNTWVGIHNASILGVQSLGNILTNVMNEKQYNIPTYNTLVYVPDEFNDFMMTRLYMGDYADSYSRFGLCTAGWCKNNSKLKHFKLEEDFTMGYVRVYRIIYNETKEMEECLTKYNVSKDTIAFYYSDECVHSQQMIPLVRELENESYKFLWIKTSDADRMKIAKKCLSNILQLNEGVPQFACPANGELHVGEFKNISTMREFVERCKVDF